jgi:hypothetical protein
LFLFPPDVEQDDRGDHIGINGPPQVRRAHAEHEQYGQAQEGDRGATATASRGDDRGFGQAACAPPWPHVEPAKDEDNPVRVSDAASTRVPAIAADAGTRVGALLAHEHRARLAQTLHGLDGRTMVVQGRQAVGRARAADPHLTRAGGRPHPLWPRPRYGVGVTIALTGWRVAISEPTSGTVLAAGSSSNVSQRSSSTGATMASRIAPP